MRHTPLPLLFAGALLAASAPPQDFARERAAGPRTLWADSPDPHQNGRAGEFHLAEITWGRLVDVHILRKGGGMDPEPLYADLVIHEGVKSDGGRWRLETDTLAGRDRLVLLTSQTGEARKLARRAAADLPRLLPGRTEVPRDAALVLRFDDLLDDDRAAALALHDVVQLQVAGNPVPARVLFDPHHGGTVGGAFHATRILIDPAVTTVEAQDAPVPLSESPAGLAGDVVLRLPSQPALGAGQPAVLRNLAGARLAPGPDDGLDRDAVTRDVVRTLRVADAEDQYGGFLADDTAPDVIGRWPAMVDAAVDDPNGIAGRDFVIDLSFRSPCQQSPLVGDVFFTSSSRFLEVTAPGSFDVATGIVSDLSVHLVNRRPVAASSLLGFARYLTRYDPASPVDDSCWIDFTPHPRTIPVVDVNPDSMVKVRFSEPMAVDSVRPYDSFLIVRGDSSTATTATNLVLGETAGRWHLREWAFTPLLPFAHTGSSDPYHVEVVAGADGVTDLAGNALAHALPEIDFTIDPTSPLEANGGIVLRFNASDEYQRGAAAGAADLRGQFFYDLGRGIVKSRPVARFAAAADRSNPVPAAMIPFGGGVQTPLNPLGAKLHAVWRYADFGWHVLDESYVNLDVEGLNWSPNDGQAIADFFPEFEMRLAHANRLPDEDLSPYLLPHWPFSGLLSAPNHFTDNILEDPEGAQKVVHDRALGYLVSPADLYVNAFGTPLLPYPMNRGDGPSTTYTWRDTAVLAEGGPNGAGIPLGIEETLGLVDEAGEYAPAGQVPSIGLPLLMEFRCYPTTAGYGLNTLGVSLAINSSARPNFRCYSAGGIDQTGSTVRKNPDLELVPSGGFNPGSNPPGAPTRPAENTYYVGEADFVVRVSRAHTVWLDTELVAPAFLTAIVEADTPLGTEIQVDVRTAHGFDPVGTVEPFDADLLDAYGDTPTAVPQFASGDATWTEDLASAPSARYVQVRVTLVGNIESLEVPELETLGVGFQGF